MDISERVNNAAKGLRKVWQGHDELNKELCQEGASEFYTAISEFPEYSKTHLAAKLLQEAFWLADNAEKYQGKPTMDEDFFYGLARNKLKASRQLMDLETMSPQYTVQWWKAYRHKDNEALLEFLVKDHEAQTKDTELAKVLSNKILEAADYHKNREWEQVDQKLIEYFEILIPIS